MNRHTNRKRVNDVKGCSAPSEAPSSGRDAHATQVAPDRHPTTAEIMKLRNHKIRIGTWNVRTLLPKGKLDNVKREMDRLNVNILGLSETRWTGSNLIKSAEHTLIFSGGNEHERGVGILLKNESKSVKGYWPISDRVILVKMRSAPFDLNIIQVYAPTSASSEEDIEAFYDNLEKAKQQCKSQEIVIIMGDFNAKVGSKQVEDIVGPHGLGEQNERGEKLVEWAQTNDLVITNTMFTQPIRRRWTWKQPGEDGAKNQVDYILINKRFRNSILFAKTYPGADCYTDHRLVMAGLKLKLKIIKRGQRKIRLDLAQLKMDSELRERYRVTVETRFDALEWSQDIEQNWENLKLCITETAEKVIPKQKAKAKQKWMTEEILTLMDERRLAKDNKLKYEKLNNDIKAKCNQAKEAWLEGKCREIDNCRRWDTTILYKNVEEITGRRKTCSATGCLKAKDGTIIVEKDQILDRWAEYIKELFEDETRDDNFKVKNNFEGPPIMQDEVVDAMRKMRRGKATGPDGISVELLEALDSFGLAIMTDLLNDIYNSGKLPEDLYKSVFIALPKKSGAIECELHRTISLMSHVTKILLRIIMMRARRKTKPEIAEEQCGFVEGKGTTNAIYILRTLIERSLEVQKEVYLCFIDYTKAFDRVKHGDLMKQLENIEIDGKDIRIIQNLYWEQKAAMRVDDEMSSFQKIKRGVRQGCVLSPDLFSLYSEEIMRNLDGKPGIKVGGYIFNNLRYADDTVLIAENKEDLQELLNIVEKESRKKGLELNSKKTEVMVVSRKKEVPVCDIYTNGTKLKQTQSFVYLGTRITSDGRSDSEIKSRIAQAKSAFQRMKSVLTNKHLSIDTRKRVLQCYIEPILMYGCEAWTMNNQMKKKVEATEMWFYRRMLRIPWTDRKTNGDVLKEADTKRMLINKIRKRQANFFGHFMRKESLEHRITTAKIDGKRSRGRQREKITDSLAAWIDVRSTMEMLRTTQDRDVWKDVIANAAQQGTG